MLTGQMPWGGLDVPSIASHVMRGDRPHFPEQAPGYGSIFQMLCREHSIWRLFERGWNQDPEHRPDMLSYRESLVDWSKNVLPSVEEDSRITEVIPQRPAPRPGPSRNLVHQAEDCIVDITHEVDMVSPVHEPHTHGGFCDVSCFVS